MKPDPTWRGLLLWGLASGTAFGVAEGIMYAGSHYNGIFTADIYLVRFISCVVLHAIWTASAAIILYNRQSWDTDVDNNWFYCFNVIRIAFLSMTLHGLYDVLLKKDHPVLATATALASFAFLAWQIESMRRQEPAPAPA
jgi:hypothetical protein